MPHPAKSNSYNAGGVGVLQDFQIGDTVLSANSYDGADGMHVEFFKLLYLSVVKRPFHTHVVKKSRPQHCTLSVL